MADPERSETMAVVPKFRPTFDIIPQPLRVFHLATHGWCKMHKVCENVYNTRVGKQRSMTHQTYLLSPKYYYNLYLYYPTR